MRILEVRRQLDRRFKLLHSVVLAVAIGIQDAQNGMCFRDSRINLNRLFGQRQCVILFSQMHIRVCQKCERLRTLGYVRQFCLEFLRCFLKLILSPQLIAEKEMCVRCLGVRFYSRAELLHRPLVILHLVERFTRQHVCFGRLGIQEAINEGGRLRPGERRTLGEEGFVVVIVTVDAGTGEIVTGPEIVTRGWVYEAEADELLEDAKAAVRAALTKAVDEGPVEFEALRRNARRALGKLINERTRRRPAVIPVILEV